MAKYEFAVSTMYVGSEVSEIVEIDDDELEGLDEKERNDLVKEYFEEWVWNNIESHWKKQ